jgi:hypothetical protein
MIFMVATRHNTMNNLARRRAAMVALDSIQTKLESNVRNSSSLRNSQRQLEEVIVQLEQISIQTVFEMNNAERIGLIFDIFDRQMKGFIDIISLTKGLRTLYDFEADEAMHFAAKIMRRFDSDKDRSLDQEEFKKVCFYLIDRMDCTVRDFTHFVVCKSFLSTGKAVLDDAVTALQGSSGRLVSTTKKIRTDGRLMILFDMLDTERCGTVLFDDVIKYLDRFEEVTFSLRREIRFVLGGIGLQILRYDQFRDVMKQMAHMCPKHVDIDDIANSFTVSSSSLVDAEKKKHERSERHQSDLKPSRQSKLLLVQKRLQWRTTCYC